MLIEAKDAALFSEVQMLIDEVSEGCCKKKPEPKEPEPSRRAADWIMFRQTIATSLRDRSENTGGQDFQFSFSYIEMSMMIV